MKVTTRPHGGSPGRAKRTNLPCETTASGGGERKAARGGWSAISIPAVSVQQTTELRLGCRLGPLKSTALHCTKEPFAMQSHYVMDGSLLTFLGIAPVECRSTAVTPWHAAKGDWPSRGTTRSRTSPQTGPGFNLTSFDGPWASTCEEEFAQISNWRFTISSTPRGWLRQKKESKFITITQAVALIPASSLCDFSMFCASLRPLLFTVGALASQETLGERTERRCLRTRYSAYLHPDEPVEYSFKTFMFYDDLCTIIDFDAERFLASTRA